MSAFKKITLREACIHHAPGSHCPAVLKSLLSSGTWHRHVKKHGPSQPRRSPALTGALESGRPLAMPRAGFTFVEVPGTRGTVHRCQPSPPQAAPSVAGSASKAKRRQQQGWRQTKLPTAQAVAAPPLEKAASYELPPFEAWSTGSPIKKRTDIKTILLLGAGPIVIGQVSAVDSARWQLQAPAGPVTDPADYCRHASSTTPVRKRARLSGMQRAEAACCPLCSCKWLICLLQPVGQRDTG